jgi:hypothetical protein
MCKYKHYGLACQLKKGRAMVVTVQPYGDNFAFVIPVEDEILHTLDKPYCWDSMCGCHRDETLFRETQQFVLDGTMTPHEAMLFIAGKTV